MTFFLITKERLLHHIDYDIRKSARGTINWFVDSVNMLNIILTINGINYIYIEQAPKTKNDLHPAIAEFITPFTEILGPMEKMIPEEEPMPKEVTMEDYLELK